MTINGMYFTSVDSAIQYLWQLPDGDYRKLRRKAEDKIRKDKDKACQAIVLALGE
jgi:hypothetical protein